MTFSGNFDKHVKKELNRLDSRLDWKIGDTPDGLRGKVDLIGRQNGRPRVFVEAELKKDDPAANVIKIWQWANQQPKSARVLLIQGFSKQYWRKRERLRERSEFVGTQMAKAAGNIDYKTIKIQYKKDGKLIHFNPKTAKAFSAKAGAGRLKRAAEGFAKDIFDLTRSL